MSEYPEHEKLHAVQTESRILSSFLYWLEENKILLSNRHAHTDLCWDEDGINICGRRKDELEEVRTTKEQILGKFLDIDPKKISAEKDQMVKKLQADAALAARKE